MDTDKALVGNVQLSPSRALAGNVCTVCLMSLPIVFAISVGSGGALSHEEPSTSVWLYLSCAAFLIFGILTALPFCNHYFIVFFIHGANWVPLSGPNPERAPSVPEKNILRFFGYTCLSVASILYVAVESTSSPQAKRALNAILGYIWLVWFLIHLQSILIKAQPPTAILLNLFLNVMLAIAHMYVAFS